jgi:hypothetical protein
MRSSGPSRSPRRRSSPEHVSSIVTPRSILLKQRRTEQLTSSEDLYPDQPTAVVEVEVDCTVLDLKVNHLGSGGATRWP